MVMEVRPEQPENREALTDVILEPIITSTKDSSKLGELPERFLPRYNFSIELGKL